MTTDPAALVAALAAIYTKDVRAAAEIAALCDGHLDKSGALLGRVREKARAQSPAPQGECCRRTLERAAKVAEHTLVREPAGWPLRDPTPQDIAAAIRALDEEG